MLVLPTGGKGIGVEANGSNFPFVQPSDDIVGLLADLWLAHENHAVVPPLRISKMQGFQQAFDGLPSNASITIIDSTGATIFDSAGSEYASKDWGPRLRIHEWLFPNVGGSVCRAVQHRAVSDPTQPSWPATIYPVNGTLDERASELLPERVTLISEKLSGQAATGEITFVNGWNVEIATAPYKEALRNTTALTFSANPGGGPGRYPGCQAPDATLRTINGVHPDGNGNFTLDAQDCYYIRQPVAVTGPTSVPTVGQLDMGNDCGPCCDCDAYVNVQQAILNIDAETRAAATLAENTRNEYSSAVARWNDAKACREKQAVQIAAASTNRMYADINVGVCNVTPDCLIDVRLDMAISTTPPGSWMVVPGTTYITKPGSASMIPYQLSGPSGPPPVSGQPPPPQNILTANFGAISHGSAGRVRFRLLWSPPMPANTTLQIIATATCSASDLFPQQGTFTMLMQ
jgi:hypothetical protein